MELHGIVWNYIELYGIAWNCMELYGIALELYSFEAPIEAPIEAPYSLAQLCLELRGLLFFFRFTSSLQRPNSDQPQICEIHKTVNNTS